VEPDVVVVGGGAIGVTAAYELSKRGVRVTLLERGEELAAGCSAGNAGLVCPSHSLPLATPAALREGVRSLVGSGTAFAVRPSRRTLPWLARFALACRSERAHRGMRAVRAFSVASLRLHAEHAALGTSFRRTGILSLYSSEDAFADACSEAEASELAAEVLPGDTAAELEPALRTGLAGAVLHPDEAHVDPLRYVQALGAAAASEGAELRTRVEVRTVRRRSAGVELVTGEGVMRPQSVVLAAGAWTAELARGADVHVPLTGGKGYHVELQASPGDPRLPLLLPEWRSAVTPLDGRLRLTGTLEVCGLDSTVRARRVDAVRRAAGRVLRDADGRGPGNVWVGLRPCAPDGLPVIGRPERAPELVIATGHAMKGIALAPATGVAVAALVAGDPPPHDVSAFSPDRFRRR
jgi:D-amino-acid dehydrogenase